MVDAKKVTNAAGQKITMFAADQQLCSVAPDIMWAKRNRWMFLVPRLRGMHWLRSFVDSVGALMAGSGLKKFLSSVSAGSDKTLLRRKFPMKLRAFVFVVTELLRGHVQAIGSYDEMECWFSQLCRTSALAEHWIKNFIKPLFLMLLHVPSEREENLVYTCMSANKWCLIFLLQGILTTLDMDCVTLEVPSATKVFFAIK